MPIRSTKYGREALMRISRLHWMAYFIPGDNHTFNQKLHEAHEMRKAEALEDLRAMMGPPIEGVEASLEYTGEDGADINASYTLELEKFVAESVLCSCVDTYHWFLRRVFELALRADRSHIHKWRDALDLQQKWVDALIQANDLEPIIIRIFRRSEEPFRKLAHEFLHIPQFDIVPVAILIRNCLVHELGDDREGKIAAAISGGSIPGITVNNGKVAVSVDCAYEFSNRFVSDLSIMDQALANVLKLPTETTPLPKFTRAYS